MNISDGMDLGQLPETAWIQDSSRNPASGKDGANFTVCSDFTDIAVSADYSQSPETVNTGLFGDRNVIACDYSAFRGAV